MTNEGEVPDEGEGAEGRPSSTQRRQSQFFRQITPLRVRRLDHLDLPLALPVLVSLLARDRGVHRPGAFEPDERFDAIAFGEPPKLPSRCWQMRWIRCEVTPV